MLQALLNGAVVCAGVGATIGTAILMFAPPDTIVKESCKNSYQVGFRYFCRRKCFRYFSQMFSIFFSNVFSHVHVKFRSCQR